MPLGEVGVNHTQSMGRGAEERLAPPLPLRGGHHRSSRRQWALSKSVPHTLVDDGLGC